MNYKTLILTLLTIITINVKASVHIHNKSTTFAHVTIQPEHETMHGMYCRYPMTREASGTSWVPDSSPLEGFHITHKDWTLMFSGFSYLVADIQRGKRGDEKLFDANMFMFMAQKDFNKSTLAFRTMLSAEPFTVGKCGYPLLLQTGETCDGKTPLIDRQHPHDLFGELAAVFTYAPTQNSSLFLYAALPGEPALGPTTYFMRFSGTYIPETPIGHHWMDSTHIAFGVLTAGLIYKNFKFELCGFKGREPDQHSYDIEKSKIDSYSFRGSCNPTENIALQISYGFLKSPEQLHPDVDIKRITFSAIYNQQFNEVNNIQAAAVIGINKNEPGSTLPAFLLEVTASLHKKHIVFSRFEILKNEELFLESSPLAEKIFTVKKLTLGYVYEFVTTHHVKWGLGGLISFPMMPAIVRKCYGKTSSFMGFLQVRLV